MTQSSDTPVTHPRLIYVRWSDDGEHIRKWAREPFEGATAFANAGNGAPMGPLDASEHYPVKDLPLALRDVAQNIHVECADHVLEDMVRIVTDAAEFIEARSRSTASSVGADERALKWLKHNLRLAEQMMKTSADEGNGYANFAAHDAHHALTVALAALAASSHPASAISDATRRMEETLGAKFVPASAGDVERLRGLLLSLATAEAEYRHLHDLHGDGDMRTGRGWDWMRRKGDEARAALTDIKGDRPMGDAQKGSAE